MHTKYLKCDVLIIGGGTAGCFAAREFGAHPELSVIVADKASIERSGCLAAGVNALNAYITKGHTPEFYANYALDDASGIARWDLLLSLSEKLNCCAHELEKEGLVFLRNPDGSYAERGSRNVKINGENIKPLLARACRRQKNVKVLERVNITDLLASDNRVYGAVGFSVNEPDVYVISARCTLVATGGAAGLYRPNNPGFSRHKMWYSPFNTGAGYAMGLLAGAEMTSFEMRFVALRCKDTIAPTGTIAQGVKAPQVNAKKEIYEQKYGLKTSERLFGTTEEKRAGRGPCYLQTSGISKEQEQDLLRAYLNMAPAQTLKWLESGYGPKDHDVEIEGSEPYIVGGHSASGFWIDERRATTLKGLFAAGDVAGGAPQKYVTGALAEAQIAASSIAEWLSSDDAPVNTDQLKQDWQVKKIISSYEAYLSHDDKKSGALFLFDIDQVEEAMQKVMDEYAGGISCDYRYSELGLQEAAVQIEYLRCALSFLRAADNFDLLHIYELRDRLLICQALIAHMEARKETRWHGFAENTDYPFQDPSFECYINSRLVDGKISIIRRPLVKKGEHLEYFN